MPKKRSRKQLLLAQFLSNSSMHGLKYIASKDSRNWEKWMWCITFGLGFGISGFLCWKVWREWSANPIITTIDSTSHSIANVPFPTVTICNVNQASNRKLQAYLAKHGLLSREKEFQRLIRTGTNLDVVMGKKANMNDMKSIFKLFNLTGAIFAQLLQEFSPSCDDIIVDCSWQGIEVCNDKFELLPTPRGFCCVFNSFALSNAYPAIYTAGAGTSRGLRVILDAQLDDYGVIASSTNGFKVSLNRPDIFPQVLDRAFLAHPGLQTLLAIGGSEVSSTPSVRNLPISSRLCKFFDEKEPSDKMGNYSHSVCNTMCTAKQMQEECQCQPYYFTKWTLAESCDIAKYECLANVSFSLKNSSRCECLPSCDEIFYGVEVINTPYPGKGFKLREIKNQRKNTPFYTNLTDIKENIAVLRIYFRDERITRYKKDTRYRWEDFISATGGLLGLGFGFSLLSAVEIFYFCVVKRFTCKAEISHSIPKQQERIFIVSNKLCPCSTIKRGKPSRDVKIWEIEG